MMLLLRTTFLVLMTRGLVVHGQDDDATYNQLLYDNGMVLQEVFYAPLTSFVESTEDNPKGHGHLRRELQTSLGCRANQPAGNTFVCGGWAGGNDDPCRNSQATCSGLTYPCSCSGSSDTTCTYCQVRTANAIFCQQTGTRTSFVDLTNTFLTCSCEYIGNGQVIQNCYQPTPAPDLSLTPPPSEVRTPGTGAPFPTPGIPVTPPPTMSVALTAPPQTPPVDGQVTCQATNPNNINLSVTSRCSSLPNYSCTCSGSSDTLCSYCQVRTFNAVVCQVTGSDLTFLDPYGIHKTCHCEYRGNGRVEQYCY